MYRFQNGSKCPCCGEVLEGKSEEWLELFSQLVFSNNLSPLEEDGNGLILEPISGFPPPDAGIYPPVNPKI